MGGSSASHCDIEGVSDRARFEGTSEITDFGAKVEGRTLRARVTSANNIGKATKAQHPLMLERYVIEKQRSAFASLPPCQTHVSAATSAAPL